MDGVAICVMIAECNLAQQLTIQSPVTSAFVFDNHCMNIDISAFFELHRQVTADHGPAVSGAHNTIVTARAGKDLVSALCSGLLTIGPRFGGALDKAAEMFTQVWLG